MADLRRTLVLAAAVSLAGCGGSQGKPDGGIVAACETPIPVQSLPGMPCSYALPDPPCDVVDRGHIGVLVNSTRISEDPSLTNGWNYTDANLTTIDIYGPSCDAIKSGTPASVSIFFVIYGIAAVWPST